MIPPNPKDSSRPHVSLIGTGAMGQAIGQVLLTAQVPLTVWNRSAARTKTLTQQGASLAPSLGSAIEKADVILMCVGSQRQLLELLDDAPRRHDRPALVSLTTASPEDVEPLRTRAEELGFDLLVGAMLAIPDTVGSPDALFMYSGSPRAFEDHSATLELLADSTYLGHELEKAPLWDTALLGAGYATLAGFIHSSALLASAGVTAREFLPLAKRWVTDMLAFMEVLAQEIDTRTYQDGVSTIALNHHAVHNLLKTSVRRGINPSIHYPLQQLLDTRMTLGFGGDSFSSLFETVRSPHAPSQVE